MTGKTYDVRNVEEKWRSKFDGLDDYKARDLAEKEKAYVLVEFPYPSGSGLHVGHAFSFTATDVYARYLRMSGRNVLFPMGWDAFGLPTENFAIKTGIKPSEATSRNTKTFKDQMRRLALSFDWDREVNTTDPNYYKWTQWIFIKLFEKGLAYKEEMPINWCPSCKIGLANEEVIDGKCERCGTQTERRQISQWVVKITAYADRLLDGLIHTNFIEKVKAAQINWIDKSEGAKIRFNLVGKNKQLEVFTTRPDTLAGATFMVVAPEHWLVTEVLGGEWQVTEDKIKEIKKYVDESRKKSELERAELTKEKTGVFTGVMAINPGTGKEIPVWVADYVLITYGTGAIMSVPSHDERDEAFAMKYGLFIDKNFVPDEKMIERIILQKFGERSTSYHLRDWIFSRQHYWGEPIPMVKCPKDGWVPVKEEQLPVMLPEVERYQPTDTGESPLANIKDWVETTCPICGGKATRETDTMPNWAGSDWYFLRYIDPHNNQSIAEMKKMKYWMPVDVYVGGDEHNTLHLLYSRFIYQFLWDLGAVPKEYPEPYDRRISHGLILGPDGQRMSKSKGNVISPDVVIEKFGADALRTYLMFMGPFDATMAWNERTLMGVRRFLDRFYKLVTSTIAQKTKESDEAAVRLINRLVKNVGSDYANFKFNTAVAKMMEALNEIEKEKYQIANSDLSKIVQCLAPVAPYLAEELWQELGNEFSIHGTKWPQYSEDLAKEEEVTIAVQVNGKTRETVTLSHQQAGLKDEAVQAALKTPKIKSWVSGHEYTVIFVPGRLINFVLK